MVGRALLAAVCVAAVASGCDDSAAHQLRVDVEQVRAAFAATVRDATLSFDVAVTSAGFGASAQAVSCLTVVPASARPYESIVSIMHARGVSARVSIDGTCAGVRGKRAIVVTGPSVHPAGRGAAMADTTCVGTARRYRVTASVNRRLDGYLRSMIPHVTDLLAAATRSSDDGPTIEFDLDPARTPAIPAMRGRTIAHASVSVQFASDPRRLLYAEERLETDQDEVTIQTRFIVPVHRYASPASRAPCRSARPGAPVGVSELASALGL